MSNRFDRRINKKATPMPTPGDPDIRMALQDDNANVLTMMEDTLRPKYLWGDWAHPLEILSQLRAHLSKKVGLNWAELDPGTLIKFIELEFGSVDDITKHKIWALQNALTTDIPWQDYDIFENCCLAFTNHIPIFGLTEPLDPHEMAFGIGILDALREDIYNDEVRGYIAAVMQYNGIICQAPESKIPSVKNIIYRNLDEVNRRMADMIIQEWVKGIRSPDEPVDAIQVQLYNIQMIEEWYAAGNMYVPTILQNRRSSNA